MRFTLGEILPDGTLIEPIDVDGTLKLLHSDGIQNDIVPQFDYDNTILCPPYLHSTLRNATTFPGPPLDYGSVSQLVDQSAGYFGRWGFPRELGQLCGVIALATWVPELSFSPVTVVIYASDMREAAILAKSLGCICRRPFLTPQLSRALPFWIEPTMLVLATNMSPKQCAFWRAGGIPGAWVPSRGGAFESLACPKILFTDDQQSQARWGPDVLQFPLLSYAPVSAPTEQELAEMRKALQSQFLMFRLQQLTQANKAPASAPNQSAKYELSQQLLAFVQDDPQLVSTVAPLLEAQQQELEETRQRDPSRAIVESLWAPAHSAKQMTVAEVATRTNAILLSRGESLKLDVRAVGRRLSNLALDRPRNRKGRFLRFSADVQRRVHELVRNYGLKLPKIKRCIHCKEQ